MPDPLQTTLSGWDGIAVVSRFDRPSGSWIFIHLHDDTLGPCTGGTRLKHYPDLTEAIVDGQRLAAGMTHKWAAVGLPFGGGKAVIATPPELDPASRAGLLDRYGRLLASLQGAFHTGEDLGTTPSDMRRIAAETEYVHGFDPETGAKLDPSPFTASGVYEGILAACRHRFGEASVRGRCVLIQGVGHVGEELAEQVVEAGGTVVLNDLDRERARTVAARLEEPTSVTDEPYATVCDVYAPCAVGATLAEATIATLRCEIVAGSANNQLATPPDADRLAARGILYVPDYVINAGGAIAFGLLRELGNGEALRERVRGVGKTVAEILAEAASAGISPLDAAAKRVARNLANAAEPSRDPEANDRSPTNP